MFSGLVDVINCAKFQNDRSRLFCLVGAGNWHVPIGKRVVLNTVLSANALHVTDDNFNFSSCLETSNANSGYRIRYSIGEMFELVINSFNPYKLLLNVGTSLYARAT
jgi:hypothetical protein